MEKFIAVFSHVGFTDVLDIMVMTVIIYQFLSIIRGTKAVQMTFGVFALFMLFAFSLKFKLYALHWFLSHFFDSFILILVILFQDHIRNVLVNVGRVSPFLSKGKGQLDSVVEEIYEAVKILSQEKIGALLVFERKTGLLNYIKTGTIVKSEIHSDIIYSLFLNNSPLHDGAIIFSDQKLYAAGCFLPLTKNLEIDRQFGTRHRAGIGITEGTDSFVLVVSEESGKVGYCHNGRYYPFKDFKNIKRVLFNHLKES